MNEKGKEAVRDNGICLRCGKNAYLYDNLCEDCFRSATTISQLPQVLRMKICLKCSHMMNSKTGKRGGMWDEEVGKIAINSLKIRRDARVLSLNTTFKERDDYILDVVVEMEAEFSGLVFREKHEAELRLTYGVCNRCSRQYGNYYEAVIQFRGGKRPLAEAEIRYAEDLVKRRVGESGAENAFITKVEAMHKGKDFYLGDKNLGRDIARELQHHFGGEFIESFSLVGRKDGRDVHRATYLVRLSDYRPGDFVLFHERVHRIIKVSSRTLTLVSIVSGEVRTVKERDFRKIHPIVGEVLEAVVINADEKEAQLLDPVNYHTVTVLTPYRELHAGKTVKVFRYEERLYPLPETDEHME